MTVATNQEPSLAESLADMRRTIGALTERLAAIETALAHHPVASSARAPSGLPDASTRDEEMTPELLAVITAALAAHLGIRPRIRQIILLGNGAWAQQGRATIQASHALTIQRD